MNNELLRHVADIEDVIDTLKSTFVGKDEIIEMMAICTIAQEHLLIVGPPGTAKSEIAKRFARLCGPDKLGPNGEVPYFEYLLTRFTEPNEIFGPVDIPAFQAGTGHRRVIDGLLPRAQIAFLDEVFKANSAILNSLLNLLNERVFYNGGQPETTPLITAVGAANEVPSDPDLAALYDRFCVRVWTDNVSEPQFPALCRSGWELVRERIQKGYAMALGNITTTNTLTELHRALNEMNPLTVEDAYGEVIRQIRSEGVELSDRRAINLLKLVGASALRNRRTEVRTSDFWVLLHTWNTPEQIPHIQRILEPYLGDGQTVPWRAERELPEIEGDVERLAAEAENSPAVQGGGLTDAAVGGILARANRLREELTDHSDADGAGQLRGRIDQLIESVMNKLAEET